MKGLTEVVKGRLEEAAGVLTGNSTLRAKGQTDQVVGYGKQIAKNSVQQAKALSRKIADCAKNSSCQ